MNLVNRLYRCGVLPVVTIAKKEDAISIARALQSGGIHCIEITFRTESAQEALRLIRKEYPTLLLGAGTILKQEQAKMAHDAGADFLVSPGLNEKVLDYCIKNQITMIPGCNHPTEVEKGLEKGLEIMKFFPAEPSGGVAMLKALKGPYPNMRFLPTGGINPKNLEDYLACENVIACGGSWMIEDSFLTSKNYEMLEKRAKETMTLVDKIRRKGN